MIGLKLTMTESRGLVELRQTYFAIITGLSRVAAKKLKLYEGRPSDILQNLLELIDAFIGKAEKFTDNRRNNPEEIAEVEK